MKSRKFEYPSDEIRRKSRTELMAECLKLGLPVRKDDTSGTLQLFIELTERDNLFPEDYGEETATWRKKTFREFFHKILKGVSGFLK